MKDLKGRMTGPAVLVGNGPSLTWQQLDALHFNNINSFGVNGIASIFPDTHWRPRFYVSTSSALGDPRYRGLFAYGAMEAEIAFLWEEYFIYNLRNAFSIYCTESDHIPHDTEDFYWSSDISYSVSKFGTVMFPTIQIAKYMGFNPLYLIGCDIDYRFDEDRDVNHMRPHIVSPLGAKPPEINSAHVAAYKMAKRALDEYGVKIYNATEGGALEVFPRIPFEEMIEQCSQQTSK